ncbi:hypothetical protein PANA5342_2235 [Pantoea ananatis LMG 5342]|nr:hypothetical protein PANA5342_2235 [Pantoea ananatis LMG 5342]
MINSFAFVAALIYFKNGGIKQRRSRYIQAQF